MGTLVLEQNGRLPRVGFGWFDVLLGVRSAGSPLPTPRPRRTPIYSTTSCRSSTASLLAGTGRGRRDAGPMT